MFSDTYFPYISGVVRSIERLSEALRDRGHRVTVFGPRYWGHRDDKGSGISRCSSIPIYPPANIVLALPQAGVIRSELRAMGVDIIHSHSPFIMGKLAVKMGKRMGLPVVFSHHSVYHEYAVYAPRPLQGAAEKVIIDWLDRYVHSVDAVVAPSVGTQAFIRDTYGVESTVVSNPIAAPATADSTNFTTPNTEPVLLFVGRLGKEKNLPLLLRSFAIAQKDTDSRLVLVGDGPDRAGIERLTDELGIRKKVKITGFLSFPEVSQWFQRSTLFVFPSFNETQGMVILEALAHGTPVVAVQSEASRAVFDKCQAGMVCDAEPHAMAQAIISMLAQPRLKALGEDGRLFAQRFSASHVAEEMECLYSQVISAQSVAKTRNLV